jgi:hypothetical protein
MPKCPVHTLPTPNRCLHYTFALGQSEALLNEILLCRQVRVARPYFNGPTKIIFQWKFMFKDV